MLSALDYLRELNNTSVILRLSLAMAFGGLIGINRGQKRRPAGFRTYMLVCLGAALTMVLGQYELYLVGDVWRGISGARADAARLGAQVINGIGFLGAGTVLVTPGQEPKGLTTAAGLWASGCMGLAIGAGFYECVAIMFILVVMVVWLLPFLEAWVVENSRNMNIYAEFTSVEDIGGLISCIKLHNARIYTMDLYRGGENQRPGAALSIRMDTRMAHTSLLAELSALECVYSIVET